MKTRMIVAAAAAALLLAAPASSNNTAHPVTQHDRQVIGFFAHHPRLARTAAGQAAILEVLGHVVRQMQSAAATETAALSTPRGYGEYLAARRGWTGYLWQDLDTIVGRESGWNPCRHYPSTTECGYQGINACGVPQANPCPSEWKGHLAETWRAQDEWLIAYVAERYHDPAQALAYWNLHQSY